MVFHDLPNNQIKFRFSEKVKKNWKNIPLTLMILSNFQNKWETFLDFVPFSKFVTLMSQGNFQLYTKCVLKKFQPSRWQSGKNCFSIIRCFKWKETKQDYFLGSNFSLKLHNFQTHYLYHLASHGNVSLTLGQKESFLFSSTIATFLESPRQSLQNKVDWNPFWSKGGFISESFPFASNFQKKGCQITPLMSIFSKVDSAQGRDLAPSFGD